MAYWLLKTEPSAYSVADLERDRLTTWDGVANPAALKNLRGMQKDDLCVLYHTGDEKAAVGIASVARSAYPDPATGDDKRPVVDLRFKRRLHRPVPLATLKSYVAFKDSPLVRQGRLSVVPLTDIQWDAILSLADSAV
ncbi:MAG TPA: EVE domain-containing protein [Myxococcota bacterium]|jgi:predicted RNA-binding protein with PUA-like domain|nr:EVE domain-containing protein [Myxococcota bacterium]